MRVFKIVKSTITLSHRPALTTFLLTLVQEPELMAAQPQFFELITSIAQRHNKQPIAIIVIPSLGPRPKTNPSADHFQYCIFPHIILEAIYVPDEVWGRA